MPSGYRKFKGVKSAHIFLILIIFFVIFFQFIPALANTFTNGLENTAGTDGAGYPVAAEKANPGSFLAQMLGGVLAPAMTGVIGMLLIIYGGYTWMMARGEEQKVEKAKAIITNTIIALIVIFSAYTIVKVIIPLWTFVTR